MDYELIKMAKKGDTGSFSKLIKAYEKDLYRVAVAIMRNDDDALDCIQDAIFSAFNNIKNLSDEKYFKTWLIKILVNKCNDCLHKKKRVIPYEHIPSQIKYNDNYDTIDIKDALKSLDNELRTIIVLYYYEDMNVKDIASSLLIPEGTVKSRLSRARIKLKKILGYNNEEVI